MGFASMSDSAVGALSAPSAEGAPWRRERRFTLYLSRALSNRVWSNLSSGRSMKLSAMELRGYSRSTPSVDELMRPQN